MQSWSTLSDRNRRVGKLHSLSVNNRIGLAFTHPSSSGGAPPIRRPYVDGVVADFRSQLDNSRLSELI